MTSLEFRQAVPEDTGAILETLRAALGETPLLARTESLWHWKHRDNPFGRSIVQIADDSGVVAGVRAMMRWNLSWRSETIKCVRAVDTATHPNYRRKGVFRRLTEEAVEQARSEGVHLIFNTPNSKSGPGYLKMGWRVVGSIGVQARPVSIRPARLDQAEIPSMDRLAPGIEGPESIPLTASSTPAGRLRTQCTPDYLRWRFTSHPTASYGWIADGPQSGLVARASSRAGRSELVVSDLLGEPRPRVISSAARLARTQYMAGWFSPGSAKRRISVRGGLLPIPGIRALQLVARPLADLDMDVLRLHSWDLATSDLELL